MDSSTPSGVEDFRPRMYTVGGAQPSASPNGQRASRKFFPDEFASDDRDAGATSNSNGGGAGAYGDSDSDGDGDERSDDAAADRTDTGGAARGKDEATVVDERIADVFGAVAGGGGNGGGRDRGTASAYARLRAERPLWLFVTMVSEFARVSMRALVESSSIAQSDAYGDEGDRGDEGLAYLTPRKRPRRDAMALLADVAPSVYAHASEALAQVMLRVPTSPSSSVTLESFIRPEVDVRAGVLFARLVAMRMALSSTLSPTRQQLDRTRSRIGVETDMIIEALRSGFRWDERSRSFAAFDRAGDRAPSTAFARSQSGLPLPRSAAALFRR